MSNTRLAFFASLIFTASLSIVVVPMAIVTIALVGCASSDDDSAPDAAPPARPLDPRGTFAMRSSYSLAAPPVIAAAPLAELAGAVDGPDDPSRYLIDHLVARLPEGRAQLIAAAVAPYLAAYVQGRIDSFAPRLAEGAHAMADGLNSVARRFGTTESLTVIEGASADGSVVHAGHRLITGLRFDGIDVPFGPLGVSDVAAIVPVTLADERLVFSEHTADLPYGAVLRMGLDRVVIPRAVPGATDLATAFGVLVDCDRLGVLVSEYLGIGAPELYGRACSLALTRLAAEIYERVETANVRMIVAGTARAIDLDGDGPIDVIASGTWVGTVGGAPLALSVFEGATP